jgi:G3E family GTPase
MVQVNKYDERSKWFFFCDRQVAIADVILVNKIDLISEEEKTKILSLVRYVLNKLCIQMSCF